MAKLCIALLLLASPGPEWVSIRTRDGCARIGVVEGLDEAGNYVVRMDTGPRVAIPERDVLSVEPVRAEAPRLAAPRAEGLDPASVAERLEPTASAALAPAREAFRGAVQDLVQGRREAAARGLRRAREIDPSWPAPAVVEAALLRARGDPVKALEALGPALRADPAPPGARRLHGAILADLGLLEEAWAIEAEALGAIPDEAERTYRLARFWQARDPARAGPLWARALELDPSLERPWAVEGTELRRAEEEIGAGRGEAALARLRALLRACPPLRPAVEPILVKGLAARARRALTQGLYENFLATARAIDAIDPARGTAFRDAMRARLEEELRRAIRGIVGPCRPAADRLAGIARALGDAGRRILIEELRRLAAARREAGDRDGALEAVRELARHDPSAMDALLPAEAPRTEAGPEPGPGPASPCRWFPASKGSWWIYQIQGRGRRARERWEIVSVAGLGPNVVRIELVGRTLEEEPAMERRRTFYATPRGLYAGARPDAGGAPLLRLPLQEGATWTWSTGVRRYRRTCAALGETVRTPAGTFTGCARLRAESTVEARGGPRILEILDYAPGVGLVRIEGEETRVLASYHAAG